MNDIEPKVREFCARTLDPLVGSGRFDFVTDLGAIMPMRTIGYLLGIPEKDQEAIRDALDEGLRITEDGEVPENEYLTSGFEMFAEYIEWRAEHPSDDLMTELLNAEFEDETGTVRRLSREEVLTYVGLIAGAGNETTTRLIGWTGKVLAEHPDQRREIVEDRSLIPKAIEVASRHAVFAEHALAGGDHRLDFLGLMRLRHRHQRHLRRIAPGIAAGARDFGARRQDWSQRNWSQQDWSWHRWKRWPSLAFSECRAMRPASSQTTRPGLTAGPCARERAGLSRRLPLRYGVLGRLVEVDMGVHLVHPGERNEVMLAAGLRIALGELDLVRAVQVIDDADVLAVGAEHFHVFLDALCVRS